MSRISIQQAFEPVEVDLWADDGGALYNTKPVTRSVSQKVQEIQGKAAELPDDADDAAVELLAQVFDALLVPANGGRKKPSAVVMAKWKADKVSQPELFAFVDNLTEASRPT